MKCVRKLRSLFFRMITIVFLVMIGEGVAAQPIKAYRVKDNKMYIELGRGISIASLDSFITQFELQELGLKTFLKNNNADSLLRQGWKIEMNNETGLIISKLFDAFPDNNSADKIIFENMRTLFPAVNNGVRYGINRFRNKASFLIRDSLVTFFLPEHYQAKRVMLAGSFNNWNPDALSMKQNDSGWIANVKLSAGKYWYKFIVDGNWTIDNDNLLKENDGEGNINSVYFKPNFLMTLEGFSTAKKVFLAGSFNNWKQNELAMIKENGLWQLPMYLAEGTHTYKFIVDGKWYSDSLRDHFPDGHGGFNSVIRIGTPHVFRLNGYTNSKKVILAGSFNGWKEDELLMTRTATGWELPYTLGAGNYEYKFIVDGKWISDPANAMTSGESGNSYLIIQPNHTFRLKGYGNAKKVSIAGDFNNWEENAFVMKRDGEDWIFSVHLSAGKHLYKFFVDGKWIIDPSNKLWEQNEYGTGNSVIWVKE